MKPSHIAYLSSQNVHAVCNGTPEFSCFSKWLSVLGVMQLGEKATDGEPPASPAGDAAEAPGPAAASPRMGMGELISSSIERTSTEQDAWLPSSHETGLRCHSITGGQLCKARELGFMCGGRAKTVRQQRRREKICSTRPSPGRKKLEKAGSGAAHKRPAEGRYSNIPQGKRPHDMHSR